MGYSVVCAITPLQTRLLSFLLTIHSELAFWLYLLHQTPQKEEWFSSWEYRLWYMGTSPANYLFVTDVVFPLTSAVIIREHDCYHRHAANGFDHKGRHHDCESVSVFSPKEVVLLTADHLLLLSVTHIFSSSVPPAPL